MARGWESKAVADQIEEGESRPAPRTKAEASPEQRQLKERLDSLRLSKSRLLQQLERARHSAHRNVLLNGLKAVEKEIEEITYATQATETGQVIEATPVTDTVHATDAAQTTEASPVADAVHATDAVRAAAETTPGTDAVQATETAQATDAAQPTEATQASQPTDATLQVNP